MYSKEVEIINKTGLHARPASEFTRKAIEFQSNINITNVTLGKEGNGKSIISVMSMGLAQGMMLKVTAEGDDETEAVETLVALVEGGFGEV